MAVTADICNLDRVYNDDFTYSLPRGILESFLQGTAFDRDTPYSADEFQRFCGDINTIYREIMEQNPVQERVAVITAGAPGSGKTTLQERLLAENDRKYAYVCPDAVCLKKMESTYGAEIEAGNQTPGARRAAYNNWRPGSNAAAHLILANLIREGFAFYFGSTSSSDKTHFFFKYLKEQGYRIKLVHVTASDTVRIQANRTRDDTFIQTTPEDEIEKGKLVPQRIKDTYLAYADEIDFYHRDRADGEATLAAHWVKDRGVEVLDRDQYEKIKTIHNAAIQGLETEAELKWENTVEARV